ncbi:hypothetical protein GCM10017781_14350 [Deinococcus metalli]|uniref:Uncharacterized protein n=1 Tax=Deinococcus metalli TaxID=1141878 RepID=A0ABQ3JRH8_9DEIO|nr:hypothetical protein GCM10017781_14350 [Deinococcus metalli]
MGPTPPLASAPWQPAQLLANTVAPAFASPAEALSPDAPADAAVPATADSDPPLAALPEAMLPEFISPDAPELVSPEAVVPLPMLPSAALPEPAAPDASVPALPLALLADPSPDVAAVPVVPAALPVVDDSVPAAGAGAARRITSGVAISRATPRITPSVTPSAQDSTSPAIHLLCGVLFMPPSIRRAGQEACPARP